MRSRSSSWRHLLVQSKRHPGTIQTRSILSDAFLKSSISLPAKNDTTIRPEFYKSWTNTLRLKLQVEGLRAIETADLKLLARGLTSAEDLDLMRRLIIECLKKDAKKIPSLDNYLSTYLFHCMAKGHLDLARSLWWDPVFRDALCHTHDSLKNIYFTLLYRQKCYQELSDEIMSVVSDRHPVNRRPRSAWSHVNPVNYTAGVVGMAAMARLASPSALHNAEALYALTTDTKQGRITAIYAWAALQAGNHVLAHDLITQQTRRRSISADLACNLKLAVLTDLQLLQKACDVIRSDVLKPQHKNTNICISQEIFTDLGNAVKASKDATFKLNFFQLCDAMNDYAGLDKRTLEEIVFEEVNPMADMDKEELKEKMPRKRFIPHQHTGINQRQKVQQTPQFKSLEDL